MAISDSSCPQTGEKEECGSGLAEVSDSGDQGGVRLHMGGGRSVSLDPMKSSGLLSNFTATQYEQDNQGFSFLLNEAQVIPLG